MFADPASGADLAEVRPAIPASLLKAEVEALPADQHLVTSGTVLGALRARRAVSRLPAGNRPVARVDLPRSGRRHGQGRGRRPFRCLLSAPVRVEHAGRNDRGRLSHGARRRNRLPLRQTRPLHAVAVQVRGSRHAGDESRDRTRPVLRARGIPAQLRSAHASVARHRAVHRTAPPIRDAVRGSQHQQRLRAGITPADRRLSECEQHRREPRPPRKTAAAVPRSPDGCTSTVPSLRPSTTSKTCRAWSGRSNATAKVCRSCSSNT